MSIRRIVTADARKVSGAEFFSAVTGLPLKTKEQIAAEWQANCERYADYIENGMEWGVPPPCLADAHKIVEQRKLRLTEETQGDPFLNPRRAA